MDQTPPPSQQPPSTTTPQPDPPQQPNPTHPPIPVSQQTTRPTTSFNTRPWNQPPTHFTLPSPPLPSSPTPRIAIGIPTTPQTPPASFASLASPSYQQPHIRQPIQGIGMSRPIAGVIRPNNNSNSNSNSNTQSPAPPQSFQGMIRVSTSPNGNQPWLSSSGTQGKPPLPSPSTLRPQQQHNTSNVNSINSSQAFQQRGVVPSNEHYGAQFPPPRSITQQQQMARAMPVALGSQKSPLGMSQTGLLNSGVGNKAVAVEMEEVSNRIVTKRSIQEILNQIDPSEKLEPGVEDVLVDIAEDFVESITRFGCSLAKHRKSSVLEAKDVLLHLERNWNMTLPGFGGDEIKTYKKPVVSDVHLERISAIKKSSVATDSAAGTKSLGGQSGGNTKSHVAKGAAATTEAA